MSMPACQQIMDMASTGVGPALRAVDCVAGQSTAAAFGRLFGSYGAMVPVLTILLTLYIAFFAFSLMTGRSSLGVSALTPRMLTLGLVLTFATSWVAYQTVFWNIAVGGPDWIAGVLMDAKGSAVQVFADRIDIVFDAVAQIAGTGSAAAPATPDGGAAPAAAAGAGGLITPETIMWLGAMELLLGTVGVLLTARIALAILMALGPIFVVLALFNGTRGLTAGWLRGVVLTAITPLFVVLGGMLMLELLVPVLSALSTSSQMGQLDARAAMAFFVVCSVHVALMVMVFKVAGTMVMGWDVFGLGRRAEPRTAGLAMTGAAHGTGHVAAVDAGNVRTSSARTAAMVAAAGAVPAVSEPASSVPPGSGADRRTVITQVSGGGIAPMATPVSANRAKGIGSRFHSASNDIGRAPAKEMLR